MRSTHVDLRGADIQFNGRELSNLVLNLVIPRLNGREWTTALVVQKQQFGVSRQYQVFAEQYSTDCIFYDPDEALCWLLQQGRERTAGNRPPSS